jgi:hypothetical protein
MPGKSDFMISTYDLHGFFLGVAAGDDRPAGVVGSILGPFQAAPSAAADFSLALFMQDAPLSPPGPEMEVTWQGILPGDHLIVCRRAGGHRQIEIAGLVRADLFLDEGRAEIRALPAGLNCLLECLVLSLCQILGRWGRHVVHAASLFLPVGTGRRAVLLSGASGAGKTTAALALAHAGLCLMTDDATFVQRTPAGGPPRVWGLPLPFKVHRRTLELLPWLSDLPVRAGRTREEFALSPAAMNAHVGEAEAQPSLILFLDPRNEVEHVLEPIDRASAVERLTRESVRAPDADAWAAAADSFGAVVDMVRHSRTYRLSISPRVETLHELIRPLLEQPAR